MKYSGEYIEFKSDGSYESVSVRVNPDEILDELQRCIKHMKNRIESLESELEKTKDEKFADETIQKLQKENKELKEDYYRGFPISEEEDKKIKDWMDKWMDDHIHYGMMDDRHYGIKNMGAIAGGFTYKFTPTSIGTSGKVIAPNGDEFEFQEIG